MTNADFARSTGLSRPTTRDEPDHPCAIAPHRGDVTTVQAANYVRLQEAKRIEKLQAHAPSHRTAGTAAVPVRGPRTGPA